MISFFHSVLRLLLELTIKKKAKTQVIDQVNALLRQCRDYTPFTQIEDNLKKYDQIINNSKLELVCMEDKTYIKFYEEGIEEGVDKTNNQTEEES